MRLWICAAAVNGFLAVALGAYAAHSLGGRIDPERVGWVEVGADTGLAHALALLGVGLLYLAGWAALFAYGLGLRGGPEAHPNR